MLSISRHLLPWSYVLGCTICQLDSRFLGHWWILFQWHALNLPKMMTLILPLTPQHVVPFKHNSGKQCIPNFTLSPRNLIARSMFQIQVKNVLPSTWVFKIKCYPDGWVKKFKARCCARGEKQQEGIDYFETWAPVIQWLTVHTVMTLSVKLNLLSVQYNITAVFIHARVPITGTIEGLIVGMVMRSSS